MGKQQWFVAYTYSRSEKKIHTRMQQLGIESYLPMHKVRKQWSDRIKIMEVPLFPSYLFVHTFEVNLPKLSQMHGLARFLTFENKPATLKDHEIDWIGQILKGGNKVIVEARNFVKGDKVVVRQGPLKGLEGIFPD